MTKNRGKEPLKMGNARRSDTFAGDKVVYSFLIARALHEELGGSRRAIKTLMRWTGASERTSKNWLAGTVGPNAPHLLLLMKYSDNVFSTVLKSSARQEASALNTGVRLLLERAVHLLS